MTQPNDPPPPLMPNQLPPVGFGTRYQPGPAPGTFVDGMVAVDVPCRKCAYNLRGLPAQGRCPECGASIGFSLMGDLLCYSDPKWVDTLRRGARSIMWGVIGIFALGIFSVAIREMLQQWQTMLFILLGYLLIYGGAWLLTSPDPSGLGEDKYGTSRRLIRITLLVAIVNQVLSIVERIETFPPAIVLVLGVIRALAGLAFVVGFVAQMNYLGKLASRIPDPTLTSRARFLGPAIGSCLGIIIAISFVTRSTARAGQGSAAFMGAGCLAGIIVLILLFLFTQYLVLLENLCSSFKQAANFARQNWATGASRPDV